MIDRDGRLEANSLADSGDAPLDPVELAFIAKLRERVSVGEDFDNGVMTILRAESNFRPGMSAISRGRSRTYITVALFGLALAASAAFVASARMLLRKRSLPATSQVAGMTVVPATKAPERAVRFRLVRTGASRVAVAGSFNGWSESKTPLREVAPDTWEAEVPLDAGRYVYQFVVDGKQWVTDPHAPRDAGDDFGATNSVVTVASGASS